MQTKAALITTGNMSSLQTKNAPGSFEPPVRYWLPMPARSGGLGHNLGITAGLRHAADRRVAVLAENDRRNSSAMDQ
jgi:hypothetical protein